MPMEIGTPRMDHPVSIGPPATFLAIIHGEGLHLGQRQVRCRKSRSERFIGLRRSSVVKSGELQSRSQRSPQFIARGIIAGRCSALHWTNGCRPPPRSDRSRLLSLGNLRLRSHKLSFRFSASEPRQLWVFLACRSCSARSLIYA